MITEQKFKEMLYHALTCGDITMDIDSQDDGYFNIKISMENPFNKIEYHRDPITICEQGIYIRGIRDEH